MADMETTLNMRVVMRKITEDFSKADNETKQIIWEASNPYFPLEPFERGEPTESEDEADTELEEQ